MNILRRPWSALAPALLASLLLSCSSDQKMKPKVGPLVEAVYGIGTVTARNTYQLKIGIVTNLKRTYVKEGQTVASGTPLVAFDDGQVFRAPFAGVITSLPYQQGETVFPQLPVLTLTQMDNAYVVVSLEQSAALRVKAGQEALLSFETLRGQKLQGKVTSIYPKDGQFYVNIEAPQMPADVLVGMTADTAIQVTVKEKVLQIPLVVVDKGRVRLVRKGSTQKVEVKLGAMDGTWAEVLDDSVRPDDTILAPGKR